MTTITLVAAIFSLALTLGVLWVNPTRFSNQVFAFVMFVQTAWLGCVYRAMQSGLSSVPNRAAELEWWFRANAAVISFLPASIWLLKGAIISQVGSKRRTLVASLPFFALSVGCVFLSFSQSFVSRDTSGFLNRGIAYYILVFMALGVFAACIVQIWREMNVHTGIRRVELQFLGLNVGGAALLVGGLNVLGNYLNVRAFNRGSMLLVFVTSALTAWALLFHRVVNAREVLLRFGRRATFVVALSTGIYAVWKLIHTLVAEPFGLLFSIGICSSIVVWLDRKSGDWFEGHGQQKLAGMRRTAIEIGGAEFNTDKLVSGFETLLRTEYQTRSAALLFDQRNSHGFGNVTFDKSRIGHSTLLELGWATPESLLRRRSTDGLEDLHLFLAKHALGVVVTVPFNSPSPTMLVALGTKIDDWPFTYTEVERLQSIAELMDNMIMRSKLVAAATARSRMEYLAMISRGLAHDLKNLITPISSFLVHMDGRFPADSVEAEVHAAARNSARVMSDYVRETLSFSERLEPRIERVDVMKICATTQAVLASRAATRKVAFTVQCEPCAHILADGVLLERLLANLVGNAIDASEPGRTVSLFAGRGQTGWLRLEVSDQGCGIPPENIMRIFDPYFTTKQFGGDVRGFGLGLTICQKIVLLHNGKISVKSEVGRGTTVMVDLPVDQLATTS